MLCHGQLPSGRGGGAGEGRGTGHRGTSDCRGERRTSAGQARHEWAAGGGGEQGRGNLFGWYWQQDELLRGALKRVINNRGLSVRGLRYQKVILDVEA